MIKVFTFCFNNAEFLWRQQECFKKHLKEEHELICINNASNMDNGLHIEIVANNIGVECIIPQNIDHSEAGRSHQSALNWAWKELISKHDDTVIIVDHDMFCIKEFKLFKDYDVATVMQGRGEHIRYFHPGIMIIHPSLVDRETVDFTGDAIDGIRCDTGGNWHHYIQAHPNLKIKEMSMPDIQDDELGDDKLQLCDDFLLHYRNGSNWAHSPQRIIDLKLQKLDKMLGI